MKLSSGTHDADKSREEGDTGLDASQTAFLKKSSGGKNVQFEGADQDKPSSKMLALRDARNNANKSGYGVKATFDREIE